MKSLFQFCMLVVMLNIYIFNVGPSQNSLKYVFLNQHWLEARYTLELVTLSIWISVSSSGEQEY